ncbi:methyltransferase domain-containing protein [Pseudonocardia parietis]|uniref:Protein-L-isoaspartate O-methyltransferase n=1 Tax=Pseudonocardia parietis TaxID=570936 RepID=A0ABS4VRT3_9PSEU|nr:methyltransferase domain-containing protein [Pseudonocardia parietis]MBP2366650.1 protein-L-isoaspartate(D-aspartate) O-methyltransferase [Pseudonocardia parietis]
MPTAESAEDGATAEARAQLVADLVREGRVHSPRIRAALEAVPRHLFLPGHDPATAYADEAVPIKSDGGVTVSSVSQPSMVAIMLEQLDAAPGHRVLEIGAGAGWNAGLLAHVVGPDGAVTTVDIDDDLVAGARANLAAAGVDGVETVIADGAGGHPGSAPYDRIELTVGSTGVRPEWVAQLVPGGRLVLPLTVRGSQLSVAFALTGPGRLSSTSVRSCAFVRLRGAGADPGADAVLPGCGWTVQSAGPGAGPAGLRTLERAVREPGEDRPSPAPGSVSDLWDGLGLWCALADPAVVRLFGPSGPGLAAALFPLAGARAGLGLTGHDGCAVLLAEPAATIRSFGPGAGAAADRLGALIEDWVAAGRPHAADLRIDAVVPALAVAPGPGPDADREIIDSAGTRLRLSWDTGRG